jgi:hypothetical protein
VSYWDLGKAGLKTQEVFMDLNVLKRKISTYRSDGGKLRNVSDDLLMEVLEAWENWEGPSAGFYAQAKWIRGQ